jgi:hypothetical protein
VSLDQIDVIDKVAGPGVPKLKPHPVMTWGEPDRVSTMIIGQPAGHDIRLDEPDADATPHVSIRVGNDTRKGS